MVFIRDQKAEAAIDSAILPHLPRNRIKACYEHAPGDELRAKFISPESSAALVANAFGLFLVQPELLEGLPTAQALKVDLECQMRFPWTGGRHPCLDVLINGADAVLGVESKRYEPYRTHSPAEFSNAYQRPVWGDSMRGYEAMRDLLRSDPVAFAHLDAGQLVKHALGLRTTVTRDHGPRSGKRAVLVYLYAEPTSWPDGRQIGNGRHARHREEIERFAGAVIDNEVAFTPISYRILLARWEASGSQILRDHARAVRSRFDI